MAAAYAISYVLSTGGIILLIRYLPRIFGCDAVTDVNLAEAEFSGGANHPVSGAPSALTLAFLTFDLRAFAITHASFIGRKLSQLTKDFPGLPILLVVCDGEVLDVTDDPVVEKADIVTVRADVRDLVLKEGELIGPESPGQDNWRRPSRNKETRCVMSSLKRFFRITEPKTERCRQRHMPLTPSGLVLPAH